MFLYESHLGGIYFDKYYLDFDDLYCEECGDSDFCLGIVDNWEDAIDLLSIDQIQVDYEDGGYDMEYIYDELKLNFEDFDLSFDQFKHYLKEKKENIYGN